jgi:arylsulfatase A-like enzyme
LHWQVGNGAIAQWSVRDGDWKLIANTQDTGSGRGQSRIPLFLANLKSDPGEQTNLIEANPEIVARLHELHATHLSEK